MISLTAQPLVLSRQRVDDVEQKYLLRQACLSEPLPKRAPLAVELDVPTAPVVVVLVNRQCPSAILRRVLAVVVDTFHGVQGTRLRSHVSEERREVVQPLVTHRDATRPVVSVGPSASVVAPRLGSSPCSVLSALAHTVCTVTLGRRFADAASATPTRTAKNGRQRNVLRIPTGACASRHSSTSAVTRKRHDVQAAELLSNRAARLHLTPATAATAAHNMRQIDILDGPAGASTSREAPSLSADTSQRKDRKHGPVVELFVNVRLWIHHGNIIHARPVVGGGMA